jgi:hypothetical protein
MTSIHVGAEETRNVGSIWQYIKDKLMVFSPLNRTKEVKESLRYLDSLLEESTAATDRSIQISNAVKTVAQRLQENVRRDTKRG